ncbi:ABC-three component system protein [Rhodococcoides yunnanense]|uniref:ABC-three component system protein n=1 Tax=Rhodococcoides yunnanense TaxID=278209 RepID=UPI0022B1BC77|nr:ABC-three component system protein [Rhodococcus yunnanensis]MCZ4279002.1 hypothetical protein [Rhodococcus yunnanensis]
MNEVDLGGPKLSNREPDPLESQVRMLFGRSGGRCAYTDCGKLLVVPSSSRRDQPKNVAKIGHITAASPGGPRYDPLLTKEERRSSANLILLCGNHHDAVDSQLVHHTTNWLLDAKRFHEETMDRAAEYAMGSVGFKELQMVCDGLVMGVTTTNAEILAIDEAIGIREKLRLNSLGPETRASVELGMAQDREVRKYLSTMDQLVIGFSNRLTARFKAVYFGGLADGLSGDDLFASIMGTTYAQCGPSLTPEVQAASLAVVVHLFSICEIFEHEPLTSR